MNKLPKGTVVLLAIFTCIVLSFVAGPIYELISYVSEIISDIGYALGSFVINCVLPLGVIGLILYGLNKIGALKAIATMLRPK